MDAGFITLGFNDAFDVGRAGLGFRAGVRLWRLEPGIFFHGGAFFRPDIGGPAVDEGGMIDLRIARAWTAGFHVACNEAWASGWTSPAVFPSFGLHADLAL